jgi:high-affinity nickel permease
MQDLFELLGVSLLMISILAPIFWFVGRLAKQRNELEIEKLKVQQATFAAAAGVANPSIQSAQLETLSKSNTEVLAALKSLTTELQRQNVRLQNLESIVTSPGFLTGQGVNDQFHTLTEEQQAAELAKQIAAREGRTT